jgi:hypothetical protein
MTEPHFEAEFSEDDTPKVARMSAKTDVATSAPKITTFSANWGAPSQPKIVSVDAKDVAPRSRIYHSDNIFDDADDKLGRAQDDDEDLGDWELDTDIQMLWESLSPDQQAFAVGSIWGDTDKYLMYDELPDFEISQKKKIKDFLIRVEKECPTIVVRENIDLSDSLEGCE